MRKKTKIIFIVLGFAFSQAVCSQSLISKLYAEVIPNTFDTIRQLPIAYKIHVQNEIYLQSNFTSDSLKLDIKSPIQWASKQIGILNVTVTTKEGSLNYYRNNNSLIIDIPRKASVLKLSYDIVAPNLLSWINVDNLLFSEFYFQDKVSWYFEHPDMISSLVVITVPDNTTLFANTPKEIIAPNTYSLNTNVKDISFVVLNNRVYESFSGRVDNCLYTIHMNRTKEYGIKGNLKGKEKLTDVIISKEKFDTVYIEKKIKEYESSINKVCSFFEINKDINVDIVECYWGNEETANGRSFGNFMLIDTSFVKGSSFIHEFIHCIDPLNDYYDTADSAKFLFSESMIEYLSHYIFYRENIQEREYIENTRMIYYTQKVQSLTSIFEVKENNPKTQPIIYTRTPFVIKEFAIRIGEELFIDSLKKFYQFALSKKTVNLEDFKSVLLSNGISKREIDLFFEQL